MRNLFALLLFFFYYCFFFLIRKRWRDVPKDVVLVHAFPKSRFAPNVSPFVLRLETYLRLAKIPYQVMMTNLGYS